MQTEAFILLYHGLTWEKLKTMADTTFHVSNWQKNNKNVPDVQSGGGCKDELSVPQTVGLGVSQETLFEEQFDKLSKSLKKTCVAIYTAISCLRIFPKKTVGLVHRDRCMYKDSHFGGVVIADRQQQPVNWKRT